MWDRALGGVALSNVIIWSGGGLALEANTGIVAQMGEGSRGSHWLSNGGGLGTGVATGLGVRVEVVGRNSHRAWNWVEDANTSEGRKDWRTEGSCSQAWMAA
jgi:hypothetical protein